MNVSEILDFGCKNAGTTVAQVWTSDALKFANITYHELEEKIRNYINEDYFYDYFTTDLVAGQNEYVLEYQSATHIGINKVLSVGVKYNTTDTQFTPIRGFGSGSMTNTDEYNQANQSASDPFYVLKDNSIFIYPAPTVSNTGALRVHASINLVDLLSGDAESAVKIPRNFHFVIGLGMKRYINNYRSLDGTGIDQQWDKEYEDAVDRMILELRNRTLTPLEQEAADFSSLYY